MHDCCENLSRSFVFFFFNDTATTEIYTLSLHDALPISCMRSSISKRGKPRFSGPKAMSSMTLPLARRDRKSTRLNSSHGYISYAVFCLKKKKQEGSGPTDSRFASLQGDSTPA